MLNLRPTQIIKQYMHLSAKTEKDWLHFALVQECGYSIRTGRYIEDDGFLSSLVPGMKFAYCALFVSNSISLSLY